MSPWSILLLRVVVCVALVFNGAASAVASVHMHHGGMAEAISARPDPAPANTADAPPCHQARQVASTASTGQPAAIAASTSANPGPESPSAPDCCKSGACQCVCVHHAQATILVLAFDPALTRYAGNMRPTLSAHASPSLPHLIRPPIFKMS